MTEAQIAYDAVALDKMFAFDYIEISPLGVFDPREKVVGFYSSEAKAQAGNEQVKVETSDFSVRLYDDKFAVIISRFTFTRRMEGQTSPPPFNMRATVVCRREKGVWKIITTSYTGIRPPQSPPAPTKSE